MSELLKRGRGGAEFFESYMRCDQKPRTSGAQLVVSNPAWKLTKRLLYRRFRHTAAAGGASP
jgi:hypothetical protein